MTDGSRAACTIIAENYVAHARVLARSFRRHHPEAAFYVLLADELKAASMTDDEPFTLVRLTDVSLPSLNTLAAQSSLKEFATAVKPAFLQYLLGERQHGTVLFLDPDMLVLESLEPLFEALGRASILLIPHATSPVPRTILPGDREILQVGTYNLGFIGMAASPETSRILAWWADRLSDGCREDVSKGLFVDQKWIDLLPGYTERTTIIRDPGYNVAYWNLHERSITTGERGYLVNGQPLRLYHFSGFLPDQPGKLTRYQTTHRLHDQPALQALHAHYAKLLREAGYDRCKGIPYAYGPPLHLERPHSLLARRHHWEPYQCFCRFLRMLLGPTLFVWLRSVLRGQRGNHYPSPPSSRETTGPLPFGVNFSGYLLYTSGVGQASRGNVEALAAAGIPHAVLPINYHAKKERAYRRQPYRFNLIQVNADQMPIFAGGAGPGYFQNRYSIGYWMWETTPFPQRWLRHFTPLQEIWTASTFTSSLIQEVSPIPVRTIPHVIDVSRPCAKTRAAFGLPEDRFLFLFVFDFLSIFERKNPLGLLDAFLRAFPAHEPVSLVLKSVHGDECPHALQQLRAAAQGHPCILLEHELSRDETMDLMACCDGYVSLHRSEGFGMTIAEAMALGKPVIATAYGGNTDFMDDENAFPVRWHEGTLPRDIGPYPAGSRWAEPDLDHAASCLREVIDHPAEAVAKGIRARTHIQEHYCARAVGAQMRERLNYLSRYY